MQEGGHLVKEVYNAVKDHDNNVLAEKMVLQFEKVNQVFSAFNKWQYYNVDWKVTAI